MFDAEFGEGVDHRIGHRRQRADIAGFAGALGAERIVLVGTGFDSTSMSDRLWACAWRSP